MADALDSLQLHFLEACRVGHLATADAGGAPHLVPVCYAAAPRCVYVPVDEKPKQGSPHRLKRLRNIAENPSVAFLADHYEDRDWSRLGWLMVRGSAEILASGQEHAQAVVLLRRRYAQYLDMALDALPVIAIRIARVSSWGALQGAPGEASRESAGDRGNT